MNVQNILVSKYFCALELNIFRTLLFEHTVAVTFKELQKHFKKAGFWPKNQLFLIFFNIPNWIMGVLKKMPPWFSSDAFTINHLMMSFSDEIFL